MLRLAATTEVETSQLVSQASLEWVQEISNALHAEGRLIEGGWPGTVSEAHGRIQSYANSTNLPLTSSQRAQLARALFHEARSEWLSRSK